MSCAMTSLQAHFKDIAEQERQKDILYCILVCAECPLRTRLVQGITKMILEYSHHPAVKQICASDNLTVHRALIIAAIYAEPDFLSYSLDMPSVCSSALSEWVVNKLPALVEKLLNGESTLDEFVLDATHEYITL